jgi:muconolactone delta-isomerase
VLFLLHAELRQSADMTNKEFYGLWLEEAEAVVSARSAGAIKSVYKVAGRPEVYGIFEVDSHDSIDHALLSLPIWKQGYTHLVTVEWTPLRAYDSWHEDLKQLAADE